MTYVSRKSRIIVSRWTDFCNDEYILKASRKRSDGRLKKYGSCDDLRAWVNDNCIKHEYLVDLMSDGEFAVKPPFPLYGRFVPVPILFKLAIDSNTENKETEVGNELTSNKSVQKSLNSSEKSFQQIENKSEYVENFAEPDYFEYIPEKIEENKVDVSEIQMENHFLERNLVACTCLLSKAIIKLEKIDCIVGLAETEFENARNEEIKEAFSKAKLNCTCSPNRTYSISSSQNCSDYTSSSKSYVKKLRDSANYNKLMRKISCLKNKLKKNRCNQLEVKSQLQHFEQKEDSCLSCTTIKELYNRRGENQRKCLEKRLEKLTAEKGKLLSELCQALTCLNTIKKNTRSCEEFEKKKSCKSPSRILCGELPDCCCGSDSETDRLCYTEPSSEEVNLDKRFKKSNHISKCDLDGYQTEYTEYHNRSSMECENLYSENQSDENIPSGVDALHISPTLAKFNTNPKVFKQERDFISKRRRVPDISDENINNKVDKTLIEQNLEKKGKEIPRKSKVKFVCPETPCRKKFNADDISVFESTLSEEQQLALLKIVGKIQNAENNRPSTSPVTKRERQAASTFEGFAQKSPKPFGQSSGRRIKSETTMQEIEKTLRNYEDRLSDFDSLVCKVDKLKRKSSEVSHLKKALVKIKNRAKKQRTSDREKSNKEITRLCSENWELKILIQQMNAKFDSQCKKIQNLKNSALKARELQCEAEELKKELSEYRDSFERQRKCISKWESVVTMQRTEIENLTNHIRKLTTMKDEIAYSPCREKKSAQRSRSYSPENIKEKITPSRPKTQIRNVRFSSNEEDPSCCYEDYRQPDNRRKCQFRLYSSPPNGSIDWCN